MTEKIFPSFENVILDEDIRATHRVDDHYITSLSFALDDYKDWYIDGGEDFPDRIAPSEGIAKDLVALFLERYDHNAVVGLHQKEEIFFHNPAPKGAELTFVGRYTDKYMKRGKGYTVFDTYAEDEFGTRIVRQISTEIMRIPEGVRLGSGSGTPAEDKVDPIWPADRAVARHWCPDLTEGTPIAPVRKLSRQDQMTVFSQGGRNYHNIHTDDNFAHKAGFKSTLTQGMQTTCWAVGMLASFFGKAWLTGGWIKTIYLKPVYWKDVVTVRGVIKTIDTDAKEVSLDIWIENEDGAITSVGWAKCRV
ncbi:MAG: MaoC family dehydratase [Rhodospirillum sp.]|nr:MaoC family dehydratase [Rhodospirillum sp.]MCF8488398.1 MaoC family dehydratase [Rhodospirillum sp.]MCF8502316.1 MaoC family dehydratase [Rhodospirillum sp.]